MHSGKYLTAQCSHSGSFSQGLLGAFTSDEIHKPGPERESAKIKEVTAVAPLSNRTIKPSPQQTSLPLALHHTLHQQIEWPTSSKRNFRWRRELHEEQKVLHLIHLARTHTITITVLHH